MRKIQHLHRRGAAYWWRRRMPADPAQHFPDFIVQLSLRTKDRRQTVPRARWLTYITDTMLMAAGTTYLKPTELQALLRDYLTARLVWLDNELTADPFVEAAHVAELIKDMKDGVRDAHRAYLAAAENERTVEWATELLGLSGYKPPYSAHVMKQVQKLIHQGEREAFRTMAARLEGTDGAEPELSETILPTRALIEQGLVDFGARPRHPRHANQEASQTDTPADFQSDPASLNGATSAANLRKRPATAKRQAATASRSVMDIFEEYETERSRFGNWSEKTRIQTRQSLSIMADFLGDLPPHDYSRAIMVGLKAKLLKLPSGYGQAKVYKGLRGDALIQKGQQLGDTLISGKTLNRHISALSAFWDWLVAHDYAAENLLKGLGGKKAPARRVRLKARRAISEGEIRTLLTSPVYAGCRSAGRRTQPGGVIIQDELYWLPLFELFNGLRLSEIAQAKVEDVIFLVDHKHWFLRIEESEGRSIKTETSRRPVPIHPEILRRGFIEFVEEKRKASPDERLFPRGWGANPASPSAPVGKLISRYFDAIGIGDSGAKNHALRHSFATKLKAHGIDPRVRSLLMGHEAVDDWNWANRGSAMTKTYEEDTEEAVSGDLRLMIEAIRMVDFQKLIGQPEKSAAA